MTSIFGSSLNGLKNVKIDQSQTSAFGSIKTESDEPIIQELFRYNVNTRKFDTSVVGTGTVSVANSNALIGTGTTTASTAELQTKKRIQYRAGEGVLARFTGGFTSSVISGSTQLIGLGDADDGLFFGYQGSTFGILHRNSSSGSKVETFIAQTDWDEDNADGTGKLDLIDWTKVNVFQIQFQYLGYGSIRFFIEDKHPGNFVQVHSIDYAGTANIPTLSNASLPFYVFVDNDTGTEDLIIKTASVGCFIEGKSQAQGLSNAVNNSKGSIGSTATNILTIRNEATYQSKTNTNIVFPKLLNLATIGGTKPSVIRLTLNTTLGGTPAFNFVDVNTSILTYDVAGTTLSGGSVLYTDVMGKEDTKSVNLSELGLFLAPSDTLTISAFTSSGSVEVFASIICLDDI